MSHAWYRPGKPTIRSRASLHTLEKNKYMYTPKYKALRLSETFKITAYILQVLVLRLFLLFVVVVVAVFNNKIASQIG